jgi:DMSO/TMAO reductase YedYZ molybdopterin-dependent catalytic subunit
MSDKDFMSDAWRPASPMQPDKTFRFRVPAHELVDRITPSSDVFVLAHFGIPRIERETWRLHISGLVERPCALSFQDLLKFRKHEIEAFIKCAGFPQNDKIATRNASNAVWAGASLLDVMDSVGLRPEATFLWLYAPDHGSYAEWSAESYVKDIPVERVRLGDVMLAYELNGGSLSAEHGFPVRLFVPGFYGTNSVKWLCQIIAATERATGVFVSELYNDPVVREDGTPTAATVPVLEVPPEALIAYPAANSVVPRGKLGVWGWCWGATEIDFVEVSTDRGTSWRRASVERRRQMSWQRFEVEVELGTVGEANLSARATDFSGVTQPCRHARNSVHAIRVTVS